MTPIRSLVQVALLAVSVQPEAVSVYSLSPGRIGASTAVVLGLIGVIAGGMALVRSAHPGDARRKGIAALVLATVALAVGGLVVVTAKGGVGTGGGFGGGVVAVIVGLIGSILGGLALARSRAAS
jgi:hypothetical protein